MNRKLILCTLVSAIGGLLFGFDTAVINGAIPFFSEYFGLSDVMKGWAVSSALLGGIIGALSAGKPGDRFGRKTTLKFTAALFLISAFGTGLADSITTFVIYRLLGGIAVGAASVLSPMYISEISPPHTSRKTGHNLPACYSDRHPGGFLFQLPVAEHRSEQLAVDVRC